MPEAILGARDESDAGRSPDVRVLGQCGLPGRSSRRRRMTLKARPPHGDGPSSLRAIAKQSSPDAPNWIASSLLLLAMTMFVDRHPEVRAKRASKDAAREPGAVALRGPLRDQLRMTELRHRERSEAGRGTVCIPRGGKSHRADNRLRQRSPHRRKTRGASDKCRPSQSLAKRMGSPAFRKSCFGDCRRRAPLRG